MMLKRLRKNLKKLVQKLRLNNPTTPYLFVESPKYSYLYLGYLHL